MFTRIMLPVDLSRQDRQVRALQISADIAKLYGATIIYTGVTGREPSKIARSPTAFRLKLGAFAFAQSEKHNISTDYLAIFAHDPASQLNALLIKASIDLGADLVVIGSHFRGRWAQISHSSRVASTATASVLIVRPKDED